MAVRLKQQPNVDEEKSETSELLIGADFEWERYPWNSGEVDRFRIGQDVVDVGHLLAQVVGLPMSEYNVILGHGSEWGVELIENRPALVSFVRSCLSSEPKTAEELLLAYEHDLEQEAKSAGELQALKQTMSSEGDLISFENMGMIHETDETQLVLDSSSPLSKPFHSGRRSSEKTYFQSSLDSVHDSQFLCFSQLQLDVFYQPKELLNASPVTEDN
jgi:hypothetical protein